MDHNLAKQDEVMFCGRMETLPGTRPSESGRLSDGKELVDSPDRSFDRSSDMERYMDRVWFENMLIKHASNHLLMMLPEPPSTPDVNN